MRALLVVNEFLKSNKFDEIYDYLINSAARQGVELIKITNAMVHAGDFDSGDIDFVIFWDKDIRAAMLLEQMGFRVFNSANSIGICDDKSLTYLSLRQTEIKMPKTFIGPLNYGIKDDKYRVLDAAEKELGYPIVIKENCGSFGQQVYLAEDRGQATEIINGINGGYVIQEFIKTSKGRDIRLQMVKDRCIAAMLRSNDSDFRANITGGGVACNYEPDEEQLKMAAKVMECIGLDFAGVDIMFGENGEPVFCEVNSNAHFKNIYDCTGVNAADEIIRYILSVI